MLPFRATLLICQAVPERGYCRNPCDFMALLVSHMMTMGGSPVKLGGLPQSSGLTGPQALASLP